MKATHFPVIVFSCLIFLSLTFSINSLPLSTNGRWIVDSATGHRVKLVCVNWPSHLQLMLAEGLHRRPLDEITAEVANLNFNCVRLTYSIHMFTRYAKMTVAQSFENLDLIDTKDLIAEKNPSILNLTLVEAYEAVVDSLAARGVMVVSDNHMSQPRWCCNDDDGNGFFGDRYFDPREWLRGIGFAAKRLKNKSNVVGMSLRNELRGPYQSIEKWYKYVTKGAKRIHKKNPNVLVVVSGLTYDTDLSFMKNRSLGFNLDNKLVFEAHLYSFSNEMRSEVAWTSKPLNRLCADIMKGFEDQDGFVVRGNDIFNPAPLFVSEFGANQTGQNENQNRFLTCFFTYLVENDLDWALWALPPNYYYNQGIINAEDNFGVLDSNWTKTKNPDFLNRFQLPQTKLQDPSSNLSTSFLMYHPRTGECVRMNEGNQLQIGDCKSSIRWSHDGDGAPVMVAGNKGIYSQLCLKAVGDGLSPILTGDCRSRETAWKHPSSTAKLQLAAIDENGEYLCLEKKSDVSSQIVTNKCVCLDDSQCHLNPQTQWFQFVPSNLLFN